MSKEIKNPGMELNDAELSGVSGGDTYYQVTMICRTCKLSRGHCSADPLNSLMEYLQEHGPNSVRDYHSCPYYTEKR